MLQWKRAKSKTSPYDLKVGPPVRIEVDLTHYLTDNNGDKLAEVQAKT